MDQEQLRRLERQSKEIEDIGNGLRKTEESLRKIDDSKTPFLARIVEACTNKESLSKLRSGDAYDTLGEFAKLVHLEERYLQLVKHSVSKLRDICYTVADLKSAFTDEDLATQYSRSLHAMCDIVERALNEIILYNASQITLLNMLKKGFMDSFMNTTLSEKKFMEAQSHVLMLRTRREQLAASVNHVGQQISQQLAVINEIESRIKFKSPEESATIQAMHARTKSAFEGMATGSKNDTGFLGAAVGMMIGGPVGASIGRQMLSNERNKYVRTGR